MSRSKIASRLKQAKIPPRSSKLPPSSGAPIPESTATSKRGSAFDTTTSSKSSSASSSASIWGYRPWGKMPTAAQMRQDPDYQRHRRFGLTIGVAVIAGAGAIFGAQLKTYFQEKEERERRRIERMPVPPAASQIQSVQPTTAAGGSTTNPTAEQNQVIPPVDHEMIDKQITFLEERKSLLRNERRRLEDKILANREQAQRRKERNVLEEKKREELEKIKKAMREAR